MKVKCGLDPTRVSQFSQTNMWSLCKLQKSIGAFCLRENVEMIHIFASNEELVTSTINVTISSSRRAGKQTM